MAAYDEDLLRERLIAALVAGTFADRPIRAVCEGDQKVPGHGYVAIMPPQIALGVNGEGPSESWVIWRSVWTLNLYVPLSAKATAAQAHTALGGLTLAVLDALHDDRRLGGASKGILPADDVGEAGIYTVGEKRYLTRSVSFTVHT